VDAEQKVEDGESVKVERELAIESLLCS